LNGDGFSDVLVGFPQNWTGQPGYLRAFTAQGALLFTLTGAAADDRFAVNAAALPDLDGDSISDFAVGADFEDAGGTNSGRIRVYSGATRSVLFVHDGAANDGMGVRIAAAGDVNADGTGDVLVGARQNNAPPNDGTGYARVLSGADGSTVHTMSGSALGDWFGGSVAGLGDVNEDGLPDLAVGAPNDYVSTGKPGYLRVHSGLDASVLYSVTGGGLDDNFGYSCASVGDLDGDGKNDLAIGALQNSAGANGYVRLVTGATGAPLATFGGASGERLGIDVAGPGDVDVDGTPDLLMGSDLVGPGRARLVSGATMQDLFTLGGCANGDFFGNWVHGAGDGNGDGVPDLIVGAPYEAGTGSAWLYSGTCLGSYSNYGSGLAGTGGLVPQIGGTGCPASKQPVSIDVTNGRGGAPGALFVGVAQSSIPVLGGTLLTLPIVFLPSFLGGTPGQGGAGSASIGFTAPCNPNLSGVSIYWQAVYLDPAAVQGISFTPGLKMTF
jgi:hypothetical protein